MSIQVVKIREFSGHSQAVYALCRDTDPRCFYSAGGDGMLVRWHMDETDGTMVAKLDSATYVLFAWNGLMMAGTHEGLLSVFEVPGFALKKHVQFNAGPVFDVIAFQNHIVIATGSGKLLVLDHALEWIMTIELSTKSLRKLAVMGDQLLVSGSEGLVWLMDAEFKATGKTSTQQQTVFALACHPHDELMLAGGRDAVIRLYKDLQEQDTIKAHLLHIHDIVFNHDHTLFISGSMDKTIKVWSYPDNRLLKVIDHEKYGGHTSSVNKILWFDKNNLISCSDDRTLKCFEILEK